MIGNKQVSIPVPGFATIMKKLHPNDTKCSGNIYYHDFKKTAFLYEKEELAELQAHVKALKEKYVASNPARVSELEIDLRDEQKALIFKIETFVEKTLEIQLDQEGDSWIIDDDENTLYNVVMANLVEFGSALNKATTSQVTE